MRHNRSEHDANAGLKAGIRRRRPIAPTPRRRFRVLPVLRAVGVLVFVAFALHITSAEPCRDGNGPARLCID